MVKNKEYICRKLLRMFLNNKVVFLLMLLACQVFSQEKEEVRRDSTHYNKLEEVVVTGQYNPKSIKKSVYNVTIIDKKQIESQAANNLADVLNFKLNLTVIPNSQSGKSTISMFGLDSQYFNILIDNVPLVSDNGIGNNIDLTQINLDDVERIELVEGAMGVEYGANSVSGVINIITKKSSQNKWNIQAAIQEETVSNEYALFNEGKHIQSVNLAHNFSENWFGRVSFNRTDFTGFLDDRKGRDYYKNDLLRGYSWLPKEQINATGFLNYKKDQLNLSYKFNYYNDNVNFYNPKVDDNIDVDSQTSNPFALDRVFKTERFVNNINLNGVLASGSPYSFSASYQTQKRRLNKFTYFILSGNKTNEEDKVYQSSNVFFSKGTISNFIKSNRHNFQLGYEARYIEGFDTQASGEVTQQDKTRTQGNYALFGSSEVKFSDALMVRPGLRYEYNSLFHSKLQSSLSARYLFKNGFELRGNIGTSYRTPSFQELYYYFVDSNHDVRGNENLNPESGYSASINLKKRSWFDDSNIALLNSLKIDYLNLEDKIDLAIVNSSPLQYQYINVDAYKLWGVSSRNTIKANNWSFNLGANLQGIAQVANNEINAQNDFLYSFQLTTSASYKIKKWDTIITLLLKHNGEQQNYIASGTDENKNSTFTKTTTQAYNWLDASVQKSFLNKKLQATIGARNLFDVTSVNVSNAATTGAHSTNNNSLLLGYGRSYYLKLLYNIKF